MPNKISKKDFLKISFSSFLFIFLGGFGFINSFFKTNSQPVVKEQKSGYGGNGYGA